MLKYLFLPFLIISVAFAQKKSTIKIFFDIDERKLNTQQMETLDSIITSLGEKDKIQIIGYADFLGKRSYNQKLSEDRAENVKQYFLSKHLHVNYSNGKGALEKTAEADLKKGILVHRKVELIIEKPAKEIKPIVKAKPTSADSNIDIYEVLKEGESLVWENLNFIGGRHFLLPESVPSLEKLLQMLKEHPTLKIRIEGHICCERTLDDGFDFDARDHKLSLNRAKHIYEYLIQHGISAERLSYTGFGGKKPLIDFEISERDKTTNRRVEIKVISK